MQNTPKTERALRGRLPIDDDEKIIAIYKHHWFAIASSLLFVAFVAVVILGLAAMILAMPDIVPGQYREAVIVGAVLLVIVAGGLSLLPAYLRSQEQLVLTDEALFQILQPSLLVSKVDQLSLADIGNVSVNRDAVGTIFGYGHITIETAGEQNNFHFSVVARPREVAQQIAAEHEDFDAALQSGGISSKRMEQNQPQPPQIDPQQYSEFLKYQEMIRYQQGGNAGGQSSDSTRQNQQQ